MLFDLGPRIDSIRQNVLARVDAEAEAARARFLTAGAGQALEYRLTEEEARRFLNSDDKSSLIGYPMLLAEMDALEGTISPQELASSIIGRVERAQEALAAIKRLRRQAKIKIMAAQTLPEIQEAGFVEWPAFGSYVSHP